MADELLPPSLRKSQSANLPPSLQKAVPPSLAKPAGDGRVHTDFNEPGLIPMNPLQSTVDIPFTYASEVAAAGGEKVAEKLGEKGHPIAGAALGTALSVAPDAALLVTMAKPTAGVVEGLVAAYKDSKKLKNLAQEVVTATHANGGATFNAVEGNLAGKPLEAVGMFPERTEIVTEQLNHNHITNFIKKNEDKLKSGEYSVGTWKKPGTNETVLDIVATPAEGTIAPVLSGTRGQEAYFNLRTQETLPPSMRPKALPAPAEAVKGPAPFAPAVRDASGQVEIRPWGHREVDPTTGQYVDRLKEKIGGGFYPEGAVKERLSGKWDDYMLTNPTVKADGYGTGTKFEVPEPQGDTVTIYRAVPKDVTAIQPGDYVTASKKYAEDHLKLHEKGWLKENPQLAEGGHIISMELPKADLGVSGGNELVWLPKETKLGGLPENGFIDSKGKFVSIKEAQKRIEGGEELSFKPGFTMKDYPTAEATNLEANRVEIPKQVAAASLPQKVESGLLQLEKAASAPAQVEQAEGKLLSEAARQRIAATSQAAEKGQLAELKQKESIAPRSFLDMKAQQGQALGPIQQHSAAVREADISYRTATLKDKQDILKFGIKPESKLSTRLFDFVEGGQKPETLADLSFGDKQKVQGAATFMRSRYDDLLTRVNSVREAKGLNAITRRNNYVTHYNDLSLADQFGLLTSSSEEKINEAVKKFNQVLTTEPQMWAKFKNVIFNHVVRPKDMPFEKDAITAFLRYSQTSNRYIHMTPAIDELVQAAKVVSAKYPNLGNNLNALASYLTGHQSPLDLGALADPGIPTEALRIVKELNQRYISGILEGNPSVPIAQFLRLVPVFAENNPLSITGLSAFMKQINPASRAFALGNSQLLRTAVLSRAERAVGEGTLKGVLNWLPQALDREMALWAWTKSYGDVVAKLGSAKAIQHADTVTGAILPILSAVDKPALLRSSTVKLFYPLMQEATVWANHAIKEVWTKLPNNPEQAARLSRWIVTAAAVNTGMLVTAVRHPDVVKNLLPFMFPGGALGAAGLSLAGGLQKFDKGNIEGGVKELAKTAFVSGLGPANVIPARLQIVRALEALTKEQ